MGDKTQTQNKIGQSVLHKTHHLDLLYNHINVL